MQRGRELDLIGRIAAGVIGRRGVVVDLTQGDAVASPAALELAVVVVDQDAFGVNDVDFARVFVQVEEEDSAGENFSLLVILGQARGRGARGAEPPA